MNHLKIFLSSQGWIDLEASNLDVFLNQVGEYISKLSGRPIKYSNLTKGEWQVITSLVDDRNNVI